MVSTPTWTVRSLCSTPSADRCAGVSLAPAKSICQTYPVTSRCLALQLWAVSNNDDAAVFGGLSAVARIKIRKRAYALLRACEAVPVADVREPGAGAAANAPYETPRRTLTSTCPRWRSTT